MTKKSPTRKVVVDQVLEGLLQTVQRCFLIEIPPGCEQQPEFLQEIYQGYQRQLPQEALCAWITVDRFQDETGVIKELIYQWTRYDRELKAAWKEELAYLGNNNYGSRLMHFADCARKLKRKLFAFFSHFDKVFRYMSGSLLSEMRDLEQNSRLLCCVNVSKLPYEELYRIRAKEQPGFTSDYGQTHVHVTLGLLQREEAMKIWIRETGLENNDRLERNYFETAFQESGGFSEALIKASGSIINPNSLEKDIRKYKAHLYEILPIAFERLIRQIEECGETAVIKALAHMHLGSHESTDLRILQSHRWRDIFLETGSDPPILSCDALGRKAVDRCSSLKFMKLILPTELYKQGHYAACREILSSTQDSNKILQLAADMMEEVYGDSPQNLYFRPGIQWRRIHELATTASRECIDNLARSEFEAWKEIAEVRISWPSESRNDIEKHLDKLRGIGKQAAEQAAIHLGIRLLAVQQDKNTITASYTAIPLIEEMLRCYLVIVLDLPNRGSAFDEIHDESIVTWWFPNRTWEKPFREKPMNAADIATAVAIVSERRKQPLFNDASDLHRLLTVLETSRNALGHHVITPNYQILSHLTSHAKVILENMLRHVGSSLSLRAISDMVRPPTRFLDN